MQTKMDQNSSVTQSKNQNKLQIQKSQLNSHIQLISDFNEDSCVESENNKQIDQVNKKQYNTEIIKTKEQKSNNNQINQNIQPFLFLNEEQQKIQMVQQSVNQQKQLRMIKRKSKVKLIKVQPNHQKQQNNVHIENQEDHNNKQKQINQKTQDILINDHLDKLNIVPSFQKDKQQRRQKRKLAPLINKGKHSINNKTITTNNQSSILQLDQRNKSGLSFNQSQSKTRIQMPDEDIILVQKQIQQKKLLRCFLIRQKQLFKNYYYPQYSLHLKDKRMILNAKKSCCKINSQYIITGQRSVYNEISTKYYGTLSGNFGGTIFNLIHNNDILATIKYESQLSCMSSYRKMSVFIKNTRQKINQLDGYRQGINLIQLYYIQSNKNKILKINTKKPKWNDQLGCYTMNFQRKQILPSVKNMVLTSGSDESQTNMIFCKSDSNEFCLDISYPLNPLISFAIVLTSFDFKLFCQ